eukprot:CAMPEP_0175300370 /NCGR_PEP_ID=MMETSP0093-20121207/61077_1 /TAXON_ID=311494 /ORGANISM="Alexandrium monilatum, Strain CCMP3105" /LENGTH=65 /DNA_ID=CAMNT_0016596531 /DNA_START=21 /DNA_END=215 /DNA_ORIENTATION=-
MAELSDGRPQRNATSACTGREDVSSAVVVPLHGSGCNPPEEDPVQDVANDRNQVHPSMHLPVGLQ